MALRCRCEQCGREFESDADDFVCPRCEALHQAAIEQTKDMPPPNLDERPWSTSWKQDRLGVNGRVDE